MENKHTKIHSKTHIKEVWISKTCVKVFRLGKTHKIQKTILFPYHGKLILISTVEPLYNVMFSFREN